MSGPSSRSASGPAADAIDFDHGCGAGRQRNMKLTTNDPKRDDGKDDAICFGRSGRCPALVLAVRGVAAAGERHSAVVDQCHRTSPATSLRFARRSEGPSHPAAADVDPRRRAAARRPGASAAEARGRSGCAGRTVHRDFSPARRVPRGLDHRPDARQRRSPGELCRAQRVLGAGGVGPAHAVRCAPQARGRGCRRSAGRD